MPDIPLHRRPPGPHDDSEAGYRPGSLWLCDAGAFVALRATPGHAVWRARAFVPGVLDQLRGPRPLAAYGMTRLAATAPSPCIDVVRPGDKAVATIGFAADGTLDRAALARFLGDSTMAAPSRADAPPAARSPRSSSSSAPPAASAPSSSAAAFPARTTSPP